MKIYRVFSVVVGATSLAISSLKAQDVADKPKRSEFIEVRPYGNKTYDNDRQWTGAIFRKLRRIRATGGNQAAAERLPAAWETYKQRRIEGNWDPNNAFDTWGFWVWHEAQYDTGKEDLEWATLLYKSAFDLAKQNKKIDWAFHIRPNLMITYSSICQWAHLRALGNEAEDYFAKIGFDLDPHKLPEKGLWDPMIPFVKNREFPMIVPNSHHVVSWQRSEEKNPAKPIFLDNTLTALIRGLANEDYAMGRWDRAVERYLWVREWANAVRQNNLAGGKKKLARDHEDIYREASFKLASIVSQLGYNQKAITLIDDALAIKGATKNEMYNQTHLEILKDRLSTELNKENADLLAKMDKAIAREGKSPSIGIGSYDTARFVKAECLITLGRFDEAEALLREVCTRLNRKFSGSLAAEIQLVNFLLVRGRFTEAEKNLRELMDFVRTKGVKLDELGLYITYTRWAMLSGNWKEALRSQHEVLRLLDAFRMTPLLPTEYANLSRIMAELGNFEESHRLAKMAKSGALGREESFQKNIEDILSKRPASATTNTKSKVIIQPRRVLSAALDSFPSRAIISLVNQGTREAKGVLTISGLPAKISWDQELGHGTVEVGASAKSEGKETIEEIRIAAGAVAIFSCSGKIANENSKTVFLEWSEKGQTQGRCEWILEAKDKESDGAIIDAGEYADDPFFLIPVYHHLQTKAKGPVNLRVITSKPCRVEIYDEQGVPQMVDAEGNGSLQNSGDWLGVDRDRNFSADVLPDEKTGETRFMLMLDPAKMTGEEPLRVRVEWLVGGKWHPAAENQVIFRK